MKPYIEFSSDSEMVVIHCDSKEAKLMIEASKMYEEIKKAVEWMDSWRYYGGDPYYSDDWHEKMDDILKRIEK